MLVVSFALHFFQLFHLFVSTNLLGRYSHTELNVNNVSRQASVITELYQSKGFQTDFE